MKNPGWSMVRPSGVDEYPFPANSPLMLEGSRLPVTVIDSLLPSSIKGELAGKGYSSTPLGRTIDQPGFFIRGQAPGDQAVHTASDIPISAYSTGSTAWRKFVGVQKNTDVFFKLLEAVV